MNKEELKHRTGHINMNEVQDVKINEYRIAGLMWKDEVRIFGIRFRKAGVYTEWGDFWAKDKKELYALPEVRVNMKNGKSFKLGCITKEEATELKEYIDKL